MDFPLWTIHSTGDPPDPKIGLLDPRSSPIVRLKKYRWIPGSFMGEEHLHASILSLDALSGEKKWSTSGCVRSRRSRTANRRGEQLVLKIMGKSIGKYIGKSWENQVSTELWDLIWENQVRDAIQRAMIVPCSSTLCFFVNALRCFFSPPKKRKNILFGLGYVDEELSENILRDSVQSQTYFL